MANAAQEVGRCLLPTLASIVPNVHDKEQGDQQ
ncbi:uncharacterized protein METZ01_LOCUS245579 [marine metagenome]|uniref:Uncharacterized protein n=1 Tax=marine metagenome TaxID=408172 RepID=A0A382I022_9ZZZZ